MPLENSEPHWVFWHPDNPNEFKSSSTRVREIAAKRAATTSVSRYIRKKITTFSQQFYCKIINFMTVSIPISESSCWTYLTLTPFRMEIFPVRLRPLRLESMRLEQASSRVVFPQPSNRGHEPPPFYFQLLDKEVTRRTHHCKYFSRTNFAAAIV
jgi:hypothetical protein